MKFILDNNEQLEFAENFNIVDINSSPFKQIINKTDYSSFSFERDNEIYSLADTAHLQVNVINVGLLNFFFKKDGFKKDEIFEKVSLLKEMEVVNKATGMNKVQVLLSTLKDYYPLFVVIRLEGQYAFDAESLEFMSQGFKFFFINPDIPLIVSEEPEPVKDEQKNDEDKLIKEKKSFFKRDKKVTANTKNPFKIIIDDKYHFLFTLIAALLIGFTMGVAIFNSYFGKMVCIFFYICSVAGGVLNGFVYYDCFKANKFLSVYTYTSAATTVIGLGGSVGFYYLFYYLSSEKPDVTPNILVIIASMIAMVAISIATAYIIKKIKEKKNK